LSFADTGVTGIRTAEKELSKEDAEVVREIWGVLASKYPERAKRGFPEEAIKPSTFQLSHSAVGGADVYLDLEQESRGTIRLLDLLRLVFNALDSGSVLIADELDAGLHTLLSRRVIELFSRSSSNPKGAQLLATTHDTNLLCVDVVRRDQIWFTEKDREGRTHVFPLTDIATRNTDNLEKGYLQGRFGAIPFIGNFDRLFSEFDKVEVGT
jgi:hypothetical protein